MAQKRIFLSPPHLSGNEQMYVNEAFATNWIAPTGPNVSQFEENMAKYVQTKSSVAVSSGTAAIHLALLLLNVQKGDLVFCSTLTFVASANPIVYVGADPVFIDSEEESWNMSPLALERALHEAKKNRRLPKAVIVVHLFGQSAKMNEILAICHQYNVPVIEDAAESLGSEYQGRKSGSLGSFGIYSFNGNKIITTSGGGMLVSDDVERLNHAKYLAAQARDPLPFYQHQTVGYNYRMSNVLAGVGIAQLQVLDERVEAKRALFVRYKESLRHIEHIQFMPELAGTKSNRWLTTFTIDEKEKVTEILNALEKENIEARRVWKPLHTQPVFSSCRYYPHLEYKSVSDQLFTKGLCLPSGTSMSEQDQDRVIDIVDSVCHSFKKRGIVQ
ncbi:aminotransferase class I/II-fold pyridoxal phosphate-dependent enzyme [Bacillus sp. FJAT-52991]|uniref:Aminotransferase class I/II-fold pyridoxal phosphate-dependent enzyme n=1 Tax=Bacillus kandeliae TaxID=3129297 RepID=A0ABZ2N588_9BACI